METLASSYLKDMVADERRYSPFLQGITAWSRYLPKRLHTRVDLFWKTMNELSQQIKQEDLQLNTLDNRCRNQLSNHPAYVAFMKNHLTSNQSGILNNTLDFYIEAYDFDRDEDKAILSSVKLKKVTRPPYPNIVFRLPRFHRFPSGSPRRSWSMIPCWEKSSQLLSYA
jgi:hypothetical protein